MIDLREFFKAADQGDIEILKEFLAKGIDVDARDDENNTAFMTAISACQLEVASYLLEQGADINAVDGDGWTMLQFESVWGNQKILRFLIRNHADLTLRNPRGQSALEIAYQYHHFASVLLFAKHGLSSDKRDRVLLKKLLFKAKFGKNPLFK